METRTSRQYRSLAREALGGSDLVPWERNRWILDVKPRWIVQGVLWDRRSFGGGNLLVWLQPLMQVFPGVNLGFSPEIVSDCSLARDEAVAEIKLVAGLVPRDERSALESVVTAEGIFAPDLGMERAHAAFLLGDFDGCAAAIARSKMLWPALFTLEPSDGDLPGRREAAIAFVDMFEAHDWVGCYQLLDRIADDHAAVLGLERAATDPFPVPGAP